MDKRVKLKKLEFEIKLLALRLKYAKRLPEVLDLSMALAAMLLNYATIQSQPLYPSGGIEIIGGENLPEIIIK